MKARATLHFLLITLSGLLLGGCVNLKPTPDVTRQFALGPVGAEIAPGEAAKEGAMAVYVMRPFLPVYLDNSRIYFRSLDGEVSSLRAARWAEPLTEGIARAVALYLNARDGIDALGYYPWPEIDPGLPRLTLRFHQFEAAANGVVQVVARWTLRSQGGDVLEGTFESAKLAWTPGQPETLIAAYNEALEALVARISTANDENDGNPQSKGWGGRRDSNPRPSVPQTDALTN